FRGRSPIRNPINFALFPAFFPTQIAGPIKRYEDFNGQVGAHPRFQPVLCFEGLELIARGLFKKVVLADTIAPIATMVYANPSAATRIDGWIGLLAFYLQVYLDFSAYTDIARGSAQLLGYRIPPNFNAPYLATSIRDFWRRWHMSLSSWLRDYLYIPLGGSRRSPGRVRLNLMVTMALGGLWHGAAWHFLIWGIGWGGAINVERWWQQRRWLRPALPSAVSLAAAWAATQLTFLLLLHIFRASSLGAAATLGWTMLTGPLQQHLVTKTAIVEVSVLTVGLLLVQRLGPRPSLADALAKSRRAIILRPAYVIATLSLFSYFWAAATI